MLFGTLFFLQKLLSHFFLNSEYSLQKLQIKKRLQELDVKETKMKTRLSELARIEGEVLEELPKYQPKLIEELSEVAAHAILYHRPGDSQRKNRFLVT